MRQSVHQPHDTFKRRARTTGHTGALVHAPALDIMPKHSAQQVDRDRLARAGQTHRSEYVRRFAAAPITRGVTAIGTATRPAPVVQSPSESRRTAIPKRQPSDDIFERALAAANSHKEPSVSAKHRTKHRHPIRIAAGVVSSLTAVALIVGFIAYQNMALIQLRLASSHAGIAATMPIWQPSGFHLGDLTYSHNNVAITFVDPASSQSYTISQSPTNWDAIALLNAYVYPNNETYDTLSSGNTTIYTYGNNDATWVSGGIWYKLVSNGTLSNSQIVNIATSMRS